MTKAFSLDFETMSLNPNAQLLSVGVVAFDTDKVQTYKDLYEQSPSLDFVFSPVGQIGQYGRHFCDKTADWWDKQTKEARAPIFEAKARIEFRVGMHMLVEWIKTNSRSPYSEPPLDLWVKGAIADGVWFEDSIRAAGLKSPIHYRNIKCLRVRAADTGVTQPVVPEAIPHNALSDALVQAMWVQQSQRVINRWRSNDAERSSQVPQKAA